MKWLLRTRDVINSFYAKYNTYLDGLGRFTFALIVYMMVIYHTGYNTTISNPFLAVVLALVSAFLPLSSTCIFSAVLVCLEFASVSLEIALIVGVFYILVLLLYFVFRAGSSYLLAVSMVLCLAGLSPALLPVALFIEPLEVLVVAFGIILYGFIAIVKKDAAALSKTTGNLTSGGRVNLLLTDLFSSNKVLLILAVTCFCILLIVFIRRSRMNYAGRIAMVSGSVLYLILIIFGAYFLNITINWVNLAVGLLISTISAYFIINFFQRLDFRRSENVQFEDDDYYYFVKAVPKMAISRTNRKEEVITKREEDSFDLKPGVLFKHHQEESEEDLDLDEIIEDKEE